jgi:3-isopropylmalate/(R)-2-methylmalate dehydratase small subunit
MAQPFNRLHSRAMFLERANIDTDQIIPARFMRTPRSEGYGRFLFHDLRFREDGSPDPAFVLNFPQNEGVAMLLAGANFGCGSSREAAVYALIDYGIRCIIAPSYGEIFQNNASKNGLLTIVLEEGVVEALAARSGDSIDVDLSSQTVRQGDRTYAFDIDAAAKESLLSGLDDIDMTLRLRDRIETFYERRLAERPWLTFTERRGEIS